MINLSWLDIEQRIDNLLAGNDTSDIEYVYGVPRGGIYPAILLTKKLDLQIIENLANFPKKKVLVVDDIIDSGATKKRYSEYKFWAIWDKAIDEDDWVVFPWERMTNEVPAEDSVIRMLEYIGEDVKREGLIETPKRVVKSWDFLFSGYKKDPKDEVKVFDSEGYDEIVLLKDIELYSMCEHHLLPFYGKAHVAYIPDKKVIGVSKLARIIEIYARRAQIQERLGNQVTSFLMEELKPKGVACVIEAQHLCMQMRGVQKQNSKMITSSLKGVFLDKLAAREELMRLIR